MVPKSGYRFSEKTMLKKSMVPKSRYRFSDKAMLERISDKVLAKTDKRPWV
jgi:hypothetical protein